MLLPRLTQLLLVVAYAAATVISATSPLAACPTFDHAAHDEHSHGVGHTHDHHNQHSGSRPGDCLNCCIGTCLLSVSLVSLANDATSRAFDGTVVVYACEELALADRPIQPDPDPPKPTT